MSLEPSYVKRLAATVEHRDQMDNQTFKLWVFIGERLLHGQKQYGGFKFGEYDLDKMAAEELADLVVYLSAKTLLKTQDWGETKP